MNSNYWAELEQLNKELLETNIELKKVGNTNNKKHKELVEKHYNLILAKRSLQNEAGKKVREGIKNGR